MIRLFLNKFYQSILLFYFIIIMLDEVLHLVLHFRLSLFIRACLSQVLIQLIDRILTAFVGYKLVKSANNQFMLFIFKLKRHDFLFEFQHFRYASPLKVLEIIILCETLKGAPNLCSIILTHFKV